MGMTSARPVCERFNRRSAKALQVVSTSTAASGTVAMVPNSDLLASDFFDGS